MNKHASNVVVLARERSDRSSPCQHCMKRPLCPAAELEANKSSAEGPLHTQLTVKPQQTVFSAGDAFKGIYMVRSGFFKSYFIDSDGVMQVTGFHFPGEVFGIDGIETGHYSDTVEALDTGSVCRIPFSFDATVDTSSGVARRQEQRLPGPAQLLTLVKIMGRTLTRDRSMIFALGKMCARRRFTTFLLDVSRRMEQSGYSGAEFRLCMSRTDIANYLCLALETVSRLFTQLQSLGLIEVDRRNLKLLDLPALKALADDDGASAAQQKKAG